MKNNLFIAGFFLLGVLLGLLLNTPCRLINTELNRYVLYTLMFFVGITIGSDRKSFEILKTDKLKLLLVPMSVIIGSFLGAGAASLFLSNLTLKECLAVGSGFGYYSLSSILISQIHSDWLGAVALISNLSRELITLLFAPLLVLLFGKMGPIGSGGATAMDTTLPVIVKVSGKNYGLIAVFSGTVLTLLIPFLIPFVLKV